MVFLFLIKTLYFRLITFFRRWYVGGFFAIYNHMRGTITKGEQVIAVRINMHFLWKPLFQQYNIIGYSLGFIVRLIKIIVGVLIYAVVVIGAVIAYVLWALIPIILIYLTFYGSSA